MRVIFLIAPLVTALVLTGSVTRASAASGVQMVSAEQRTKCKFIRFVVERRKTNDDAMEAALSRAVGYGADSFYLMSNTQTAKGLSEVDGQALNCSS